MDNDQLFKRAQKFDSRALAELHDAFYPAVYRYVRCRLDDDQLCEDIASDVFMRLLNAIQQRDTDIRDARAWLLGTASHVVHDHLRQKYRRPTENLEEHDDLVDETRPEDCLENSLSERDLREAILKLTEEQQHVISLRFSLDLSLNETARIMGKSVNAIKVLQFRALTSLRRLLKKNSPEL